MTALNTTANTNLINPTVNSINNLITVNNELKSIVRTLGEDIEEDIEEGLTAMLDANNPNHGDYGSLSFNIIYSINLNKGNTTIFNSNSYYPPLPVLPVINPNDDLNAYGG